MAAPTHDEFLAPTPAASEKMVPQPSGQRKKRGTRNIIRVALFMLRRQSGGGKPSKGLHVDVSTKGMWKKLVGSMRPLHLQDNNNNHSIPRSAEEAEAAHAHFEQFEDVFPAPGGYSPAHSASSSDAGMSSRYASAQNLQELDRSDEGEEFHGGDGGDEMIDSKAEEFIANFYEQMRIQRLGSRAGANH